MRAYQVGTIAVLALGMVLGFQNCGGSGMSALAAAPKTSNSVQKELQDLRGLIDDLNEADLSCAQDSDCSALGVGLRACGGPEAYIVTSALNPQHDQLMGVVSLLQQKAREYMAQSNMAGICLAILPPQVHCLQNVCSVQ